MPVLTLKSAGEGGALGAVMTAGVGCGVWHDLEDACSILEADTITEPDETTYEAYDRAFDLYSQLYPALKSVF